MKKIYTEILREPKYTYKELREKTEEIIEKRSQEIITIIAPYIPHELTKFFSFSLVAMAAIIFLISPDTPKNIVALCVSAVSFIGLSHIINTIPRYKLYKIPSLANFPAYIMIAQAYIMSKPPLGCTIFVLTVTLMVVLSFLKLLFSTPGSRGQQFA